MVSFEYADVAMPVLIFSMPTKDGNEKGLEERVTVHDGYSFVFSSEKVGILWVFKTECQ